MLESGGRRADRESCTQLDHPGINDVLGADPTGTPFNSDGMSMFTAGRGPRIRATSNRRATRLRSVVRHSIRVTAPPPAATSRPEKRCSTQRR